MTNNHSTVVNLINHSKNLLINAEPDFEESLKPTATTVSRSKVERFISITPKKDIIALNGYDQSRNSPDIKTSKKEFSILMRK